MAEPGLWGLILAGGRSERLGRDKAGILVDGRGLLERAANLLGGVVAELRVSVRPDQVNDELRRRYELIVDVAAGIGPAAGILAAHRCHPAVAWLVLACDMPRITDADLRTLVRARDPARAGVAFRQPADGLPEPLCAIYEPATLARLRDQVEAGGNPSPRHWLAAADAVLLDPADARMLDSINTPDDLRRLVGAADQHR